MNPILFLHMRPFYKPIKIPKIGSITEIHAKLFSNLVYGYKLTKSIVMVNILT